MNRQNSHYWALENLSWGESVRHQLRWSINTWCGVWKNRLVGPVFYEGTLTGHRYLQLLQDNIPEFLEETPLAELSTIWFQHDDAPPHKIASVQ